MEVLLYRFENDKKNISKGCMQKKNDITRPNNFIKNKCFFSTSCGLRRVSYCEKRKMY